MTKLAKQLLLAQTRSGYPKGNRAFKAAAKKVVERRKPDVKRVERYRVAMEEQLRARASAADVE